MRKLNSVLIKTGGEVYREIVTVAVHSLISSCMLIPLLVLAPLPAALALIPLLYMPLVYGVYYAYYRKRESGKSRIKDIFVGAAKGFVPAAVFGLFCSLLILILWSTWWYYGGRAGMLPLAIAVFQTYFVLMAFVSQFYTLQLVLQEGMGIFRAMAESVKLFFRHPSYTLGASIQAALLSAVLMITVVGYAALFTGTMAVYQYEVTRNVLGKDEAAQDESALPRLREEGTA
ncbi:hypothetical protein [Paenibacillus caui]|uniref:hypothetical protein n=1 Tax=Paenibacillus caui TaxID=2873927 RepID=UPI001CA9981D|nr:hypothetical protein [Paenibacillus caui]